jgi:hypothetical protein
MLDVHPPHERMHGFRDFALHLVTITVGLLIALSLEGCVEWQHHRHLLHDAETGLRGEVDKNSRQIPLLHKQIEDQQKELNSDLTVLDQMQAHPKASHGQLGFSFRWNSFDDVAWKTAQSTGALAYMTYRDASTYSTIYAMQNELLIAEKDVTDEVLRSSAFPSTQPDSWAPTPLQADDLRTHIGLLRMRLMLLTSYLNSLEIVYKDSQTDHS